LIASSQRILIDIKVSFHYLEKINNNVVCDFIKCIENLFRYIFSFFIVANLDFCDVEFHKLSLLSNKIFRFNCELLRLRKTFVDTIDISALIKKISSFVSFFVNKY